jgi:hypothetical protein
MVIIVIEIVVLGLRLEEIPPVKNSFYNKRIVIGRVFYTASVALNSSLRLYEIDQGFS